MEGIATPGDGFTTAYGNETLINIRVKKQKYLLKDQREDCR